MNTRRVVPLVLIGFFVTAASGCATTTRVSTEPEGASVWIDGELVGTTPVIYHDRSSLPTRHRVQVERDGYHTEEFFIDRELSMAYMLVAGAGYGVPFFWAWWMPSRIAITMRPIDEAPSDPAPQEPAPPSEPRRDEPAEAPAEPAPPPPPEPEVEPDPAEPEVEEEPEEPVEEEEDVEDDDDFLPPPPPPPPLD